MMNKAIQDIAAERQRQVDVEGWSCDHDDKHSEGEIAGAAACYARHTNARGWVFISRPEDYQCEPAPNSWPWDEQYWKPKSPREDLVRAAALIVAEIERLDRLSVKEKPHD